MDQEQILRRLEEIGAVIKDSHFRYTSGKHGPDYVSKEVLISQTPETEQLTLEMSSRVRLHVDTVVGPAVGGAILGQRVAHFIGARFAWADKAGEEGHFEIRGIFHSLVSGKDVLIVEDVLNTGGSAEATAAAVKALGGNVVAIAALVNRGGVTAQKLQVPELITLVDVSMEAWDPAECSLCKQGIPLNEDLGHGKTAS